MDTSTVVVGVGMVGTSAVVVGVGGVGTLTVVVKVGTVGTSPTSLSGVGSHVGVASSLLSNVTLGMSMVSHQHASGSQG